MVGREQLRGRKDEGSAMLAQFIILVNAGT